MKLSEELAWRGFVNQTTYPSITALDDKPLAFYFGVDPSAKSMTIGNLASAMMVRAFISHGHKAVLLVGGATGLIGDPDGKNVERELQDSEKIEANKNAISKQYETIFQGQDFEIVDNYEWFKDINYVDFLRDIGKHVPVRQMLGRDFIQKRLGAGSAGISYSEFSYVLMQAYDFLHLYREKGVTLQICGSDQWGNSVAGVDLVRRVEGAETHVWSAPLVVNKSTGQKFGKSEDGAIWLDSNLTSPYQFYQFWLNADDNGASDYLKLYTVINKEDYDKLMAEFIADPGARAAQKYLAYEVTKLIHGDEVAESVKRITDTLFGGGSYQELSEEDFDHLASELPVLDYEGDINQSIVEAQLAGSKSEAGRFVESGAISIDGEKVTNTDQLKLSHGKHVLKRGKNSFAIIKIN